MTTVLPIGGPHRIEELTGVWLRSVYLGPDGEADDQTQVTWIQAGSAFVDLRQPPGRPWFDCQKESPGYSESQLAWLVSQQAFAGTLLRTEVSYQWRRELDLHLPGPHPDAGRLHFDGEVLIEEGEHESYVEHWVPAGGQEHPVGSAQMHDEAGRRAILARVGEDFGWARGRLPGVDAAADLLDCEFAIGRITASGWRIVTSTLPLREDDQLTPEVLQDALRIADRTPGGDPIHRVWTIDHSEGDLAWLK